MFNYVGALLLVNICYKSLGGTDLINIWVSFSRGGGGGGL